MKLGNYELSREDFPSWQDANNIDHLFQSIQDVIARRMQVMQPINANVASAAPGNKSDRNNQWQ